LPTVTFTGPFATRRRQDNHLEWRRGVPVEVSQEWLNQWRNRLKPTSFRISGDAGDAKETVDFNDDGIPDGGWTKKNITAWIKENGGETTGYNTKNKLLGIVDTILNPPAPEPVVVEEVAPEPEPVVEEASVEETIVEDPVDETLGVEE